MTYSHDHGLYLPPHGRGGWTLQSLTDHLDRPNELPDARGGLSIDAIEDVALALSEVTRDDLVRVMTSIPASWPVCDSELEELGWFLESRAPAVAARVKDLV